MDCSEDEDTPAPLKMANPEIIWKSEEKDKLEEGCLSIPGHRGDVTRPMEIELTYLDENGAAQQLRTGACWPYVSSMRSIISMVCCSSIICRG